jgi:serine phosphatase RsbU (regulator of sigma subunit)
MNDVTPVLTTQPKTKHRSIKTKFLLALLALSLLPLILFVAITRSVLSDVQDDVEANIIHHAHADVARLAKNQATIATAILDKVEMETRMAAFFAQALLRDPGAFDHTRSYPASEKPQDIAAATKFVLAPGLSTAGAQPVLDLTSNLDGLFELIAKSDARLGYIYLGTQSGVFRQYPWDDDSQYRLVFTLDPALEPSSNEGGKISAALGQGFKQNGLALSPHAVLTTIDPGNQWVVSDDEREVFSLRREKTGLAVYLAYDPRIRPWYRGAIGRDDVVWTKYPEWTAGKYVFSLGKELESQIGGQVSPSLAQQFARRQISLVSNSPISIGNEGEWSLQDRDGNNYEIRKVNGQLNVYDVDVLTCSKAVLDPEGRLWGVVGLDLTMESIRSTIIHTPDDVEAYAFLLNDKGKLVDQESPDMFIPAAGGSVRAKMIAGDVGYDHDAKTATDVFYAPIRSISSADGKSFWSVGLSMPEAEITQLAAPIGKNMLFLWGLILAVGAAMVILVIGVALRMSNGITRPIQSLGAGVMRIGSGDLDYRLDVRTHDEIEELANSFNKMAGDLKIYVRDLKATTAEKERFASELRVAHDIQMSFLKQAFPDRSDFSLFATIVPAREVGGDLYDFDLVDETRLVFYVGDVSDKGTPASLIMAKTMTLMRLASQQRGITPAEILRQVNLALSAGDENGMFVTLFIGILDLKTGELSFSNAGHNPPVILGANGDSRFLTLPDGLVLGVMPEAEYRDDTVYLEPGDMIVTYTDGVTEAMNPDRRLYSEAHLRETVATLTGRDVRDAVAEIVASVRVHAAGAPQSDDIAVLALRRDVSIGPALQSDLYPTAVSSSPADFRRSNGRSSSSFEPGDC